MASESVFCCQATSKQEAWDPFDNVPKESSTHNSPQQELLRMSEEAKPWLRTEPLTQDSLLDPHPGGF